MPIPFDVIKWAWTQAYFAGLLFVFLLAAIYILFRVVKSQNDERKEMQASNVRMFERTATVAESSTNSTKNHTEAIKENTAAQTAMATHMAVMIEAQNRTNSNIERMLDFLSQRRG